jgi:hypothetical protein
MLKENIVHKNVSAGEEIADWEVAHRAGASKRSLNAWIIFVNLWATMGGMTYGCELSASEIVPPLILLRHNQYHRLFSSPAQQYALTKRPSTILISLSGRLLSVCEHVRIAWQTGWHGVGYLSYVRSCLRRLSSLYNTGKIQRRFPNYLPTSAKAPSSAFGLVAMSQIASVERRPSCGLLGELKGSNRSSISYLTQLEYPWNDLDGRQCRQLGHAFGRSSNRWFWRLSVCSLAFLLRVAYWIRSCAMIAVSRATIDLGLVLKTIQLIYASEISIAETRGFLAGAGNVH